MAIISKTGYHFTYGPEDKKQVKAKGPVRVSKTGYRFDWDDKPVQLPEAPQKSSGKAGGGKASGGKLPDIPTNTSLIAELMQEEAERKRARTEHISPFLKLGDGSSPYISDLAEAAQKVYGNKSVPIRKTSGAYKGYRVYERDTGGEIDSEQAERMKARLRAEMGLGKTADQLRREYDAKKEELAAAQKKLTETAPAGYRTARMVRGASNAEIKRLESEAEQLRTQLDMVSPQGWERVALGVKSIGKTLTGAPRVLWETGKQYLANTDEENANPERSALQQEAERLLADLQYLQRYAADSEKTRAEVEKTRARLEEIKQQIKSTDVNTPVAADAPGMKQMAEARDAQERALRGMSDAGRFVGGTLISVGQNAAMLPTAVISPALPAVAMGAVSAADKMYEVSTAGGTPESALARGVVSGGIETLTEKIPLDSLFKLAKGAGNASARQVVKNLLKQSGIEATEEGVSYLANLAADKLARDPEARFSWMELLESAAGGALSGGIFGAGGSAAGALRGNRTQQVFPVGPGLTKGGTGGYDGSITENGGNGYVVQRQGMAENVAERARSGMETPDGGAAAAGDAGRNGAVLRSDAGESGRAGGRPAEVETTDSFVQRAGEEGKTTAKIGPAAYAYHPVEQQNYSENARAAVQAAEEFGMTPVIVEGMEYNQNGQTVAVEEAVTGQGKIYVSNGSSIDARNMIAHEALHSAVQRGLPSGQRFFDMAQGADITNKRIDEIVTGIIEYYFKARGIEFDYGNESHRQRLQSELAAYVAGDFGDGSAAERYKDAFGDLDAVQQAFEDMKREMRAASTLPTAPQPGQTPQGILPVSPKQQSGAPQQIFPVGPGQNDLPASTNHEAAAVDTSPQNHTPEQQSSAPHSLDGIEKSFGIKSLNDYVGVQKSVIRTLKEEGFFNQEGDRFVNEIHRDDGLVVEITPKGIKETLGPGKRFDRLGSDLKRLKLATIRQLPEIIQAAKITSDGNQNYHSTKSDVQYTYMTTEVEIDGEPYTVRVAVRVSPQKSRFYIHYVDVKEQGHQSNSASENAATENRPGDLVEDSIHPAEQKSNRPEQVFSNADTEKQGHQNNSASENATTDNRTGDLVEDSVHPDGGKVKQGQPAQAPERKIQTQSRGERYMSRQVEYIAQDAAKIFGADEAMTKWSVLPAVQEAADILQRTGALPDAEVDRIFDRLHRELGGSEATREYDRYEFGKAMERLSDEAGVVSRYEQGRAQAEQERAERRRSGEGITAQQVRESYELAQQAEKQLDKAKARHLLNERDQRQVKRLLEGDITPEELPKGVNRKGILEVYNAEKALRDAQGPIREYNAARRERLRSEAAEAVENADSWKDKARGLNYQRETMERNLRDVIPDKQEAERVIDSYLTPIHKNEALSTKLKNQVRERVRALKLGEKARYQVAYTDADEKIPGMHKVSESALVQLLGEKVITAEQVRQAGADVGKIENAVQEFRAIYEELLSMANEALVANGYEPIPHRADYFPHFEYARADGILAKMAGALGINIEQDSLPTDIAGLTHTFRPGKKWFGNALQRMGTRTEYDALAGLDRYLQGVGDIIYHTEDIQKLRALETELRYKFSDKGTRAEIDAVREDAGLAEEDKRNRIEKLYERDMGALPNLVTELRSYTDTLAGKKNLADRNIEHKLGRKVYNTVKALSGRVAANMVALNPGSWLTNLVPLTQGGAQVSTKNMLSAMADTLRSAVQDDGFAARSTFLTNRRGSDPLVQSFSEKASQAMAKPMYYIDDFTANTLVRARYQQNIDRGMSAQAAMNEADKWTAGVMADRSKGALPTLFEEKNPMTKLLTTFQLEVNNQFSYMLKDIPRGEREKGAAAIAFALLKLCVGAWLYNEIYEKIVGRRAAFDPIDMAMSAWGDFTDEEVKTSQALANLGKSAAEEIPFVGGLLGGGRIPVSSALPDIGNLARTADGDMAPEKKREIWGKELAKPAAYLALPFGGGQVKKAVEGGRAFAQGGSYTYDREGNRQMRFPVAQTPGNLARGVLFGQYAFPEAKEYVDSGFKAFSVKETAALDAVVKAGAEQSQGVELIRRLQEIGREQQKRREAGQTENLPSGWANAEKRQAILESELTPQQKQLFDGLYLDGKERSRVDYTSQDRMQASSQPASQRFHAERAVEAGIPYADYERYIKALRKLETDKKDGKAVSGSKKRKQMAYINMQNLTRSQKLVLADAVGLRDDMAVELGVIPKAQ